MPSSNNTPSPTSTTARRRYHLLVLAVGLGATDSNTAGALDALNGLIFFLDLDLGLSLRLGLLASGFRLAAILARRLGLLRCALVDATGRVDRSRGGVDLGTLEGVPAGTKRLA